MSQPATRWPQDARVAVSVTIHVDGPSSAIGKGTNALGKHSWGRYAIRRGVPRYLDMLDRLGIPGTFFCCGYDVETWPQTYRDIANAGHEIGTHGYHHEGWDLGDAEPALLERTHQAVIDATGISPVGWCSPSGRKSWRTIPTLKRLGYIYDASEKDLDEPYFLPGVPNEAPFVIVPNNTVSLDDAPVYRMGQALASEMLDMWRAEYAAIREAEGYLHLTIHPIAGPGSGPPCRAAIVETFLREIAADQGTHFMTLETMARHCISAPQFWNGAKA